MRLPFLTLALCLAAAMPAQAQTPCDGTAPTGFFTLAEGATGVPFVMAYPAAQLAGTASFTLQIKAQAGGGAVLSTQNVTKAAATSLGPVTGDASLTCYSLPVVPVAQIPRGRALVATVVANGDVPELSSAESSSTAPFGARLQAPALRPKP